MRANNIIFCNIFFIIENQADIFKQLQYENLVPPIEETEIVFGKNLIIQFDTVQKNNWKNCEEIEIFLSKNGKGDEVLLNWAIRNLINSSFLL